MENNLAQWDAQCPLGDRELGWVNAVATMAAMPQSTQSMPVDMPPADDEITSSAQFFAWCSASNLLTADSNSIAWGQQAMQLQAYCDAAANICGRLSTAQHVLSDIDVAYKTVSKKTSELHEMCESLVKEEQRLRSLWDSISTRLRFFDQLESIASKLNNPHLQIEETYFVGLLARVDECIDYLVANPAIRDCEIYLLKYRQLQTRGLALLKDFVIGQLQSSAAAIQRDLPPTEWDSPSARQQLERMSPRISHLISFLERKHGAREYSSVLQDVYAAYMKLRLTLLSPDFPKTSQNLSNGEVPLESIVREGCKRLLSRCELETSLFKTVFGTTLSGVRLLMEALATPTYDLIKASIISCHRVESLCSVISTLRVEFLENQLASREQSRAIKPILRRLVEDAQERLIFIAQTVIRAEIAGSQPSTAYIEQYPTNLQTEIVKIIRMDADQTIVTDSVRVQALRACAWHPSLSSTVKLMAQLHTTIDIEPFEGLAVEAVSACSHSLCVASSALARRSSKLEAHLFLVRHLVILEQELVPFNVNLFVKERVLDFSHIKNLFLRVLSGELALSSLLSLSSSSALYSFIQSAALRLKSSEKDIKRDLHALLTQTMDAVLIGMTQSLLGPLLGFVTSSQPGLVRVPDETVETVATSVRAALAEMLPQLIQQTKMHLVGLPVAAHSLLSSFRISIKDAVLMFNSVTPTTAVDTAIIDNQEWD